jgi:N-acetylglutamate synthase-like GNAT family acetyltransferase
MNEKITAEKGSTIDVFEDQKAKERNSYEQGLLMQDALSAMTAPRAHQDTVLALRGELPEEYVPFVVEPLTRETLESAAALVDAVFESDQGHAGRDIRAIFEQRPLRSAEYEHHYWVIRDKAGAVAGICGLNEMTGDLAGNAWLGWFALSPELRGSGLGQPALAFICAEARKLGKKDLYIMTEDHPETVGNYKFYQREGCKVVAVFDRAGIHADTGSCAVPPNVLQRLYLDEVPSITTKGVTWFVRRKQL